MNISIPRTEEKSLTYVPSELPPCFSKKKLEPCIVLGPPENQIPISDILSQRLIELIWIVCRALFNHSCTVPDWSGWVSKTARDVREVVKSEVGYMAPILHPITDYATVQQCLVTSMAATAKMNQEYTFVTMDLAAAKIAYDIQWNNAVKFSKLIIHLGAFHIMCSYMGAIGTMMVGSGFEEILIESGMCASGSIVKVISGKHYNRAMRVHQHMIDALERMLLDVFIESLSAVDISSETTIFEKLVQISKVALAPSHSDVENSKECKDFIDEFEVFKNKVRTGLLGKTAQFWLSYCDSVWILMRFQKAVKENNLALYIHSLRQMCPMLFSADHLFYARYLPLYYTQLKNIPQSHPGAQQLMENNGLSVARSTVPCSRNSIDITIEQTINRSAKTPGGVIGFSRNVSAYYRWCLTRHKRATYVDATFDRAFDLSSAENDAHKTTRKSEMTKNNAEVNNIIASFGQFINPFRMDSHQQNFLFSLSSGKPATEEVCDDLWGRP